jgi:hypothetical protein
MTRTAKTVVVVVLTVALAAAVVGVVAVIAGHDGGSGWRTHQTMMQRPFGNPGPRGFAAGDRSGWWWPAVLLPWSSLALIAGLAVWLLVARPSRQTGIGAAPTSTQAPASWEQFTQWHNQVHAHEAAPAAAAEPLPPETPAVASQATAQAETPAETGSGTKAD